MNHLMSADTLGREELAVPQTSSPTSVVLVLPANAKPTRLVLFQP